MDILKHGESAKENLNQEVFKCEQCGCEFAADYDEYYHYTEKDVACDGVSNLVYTYKTVVNEIYICSCPECRKIVTKTKTRWIESPTITLNDKVDTDIPVACKNCANHPSNGGSGNCNCILGTPSVTC